MKLILTNREKLAGVSQFIVDALDNLVARIRGGYNVEHNDDDTHGNVHAESIATGRVVFSDIVEIANSIGQLDNFAPGGLDTAAVLRINSSLATIITGIQVPRDENGNILDGRFLTIENTSDTKALYFQQEHTASAQYNRFTLPYNTPANQALAQVAPRSFVHLIYSAKSSRWLVHGQSNNQIVAYVSNSSNDDNLNVSGFTGCRELLIDKTAAGKTISGFESSNVVIGDRKRLVNFGLYAFEILHANTGSTAANRVYCPGQVRYKVHPREAVELEAIVGGGWRLITSGKADQWIDVAYSAGNFTASAGNWTVGSGDQTTYAYQLDGNKMTVAFEIYTSSVSAAPATLNIAIPGGKTAARTMRTALGVAVDAGVLVNTGMIYVAAGGTVINIYKDVAATAWTTTAGDNTYVGGQITFMVQDASGSISEPHTDVAHGDTAHSDADHSDTAHVDVAHGDSHGDSTHTDVSHQDTAHVDSHDDVAHSDAAHTDVSHSDTHDDVAHGDVANNHGDSPHSDHDDLGSAEQHNDTPHSDSGSYHVDTAHSDSHSDVAHSDAAHTDVSHSDSHSDTSHSDSAHGDTGHSDSHSDTVPHSDVAHVDVAHGDTVHADAVHQDVGMHYDTTHVDI